MGRSFLTAIFIINRLPSKVIDGDTPFERIYGHAPDYSFLRTFGCAMWPNLRPYNARKLQFRSKRCVFLGYSNIHIGFKCLDPAEGHVYISRDVVFDEHVFPFAFLHANAGARLRAEISLLPESLLSPSSSFGDAIFHDQCALSPEPTNPLTSSTSARDGAGENLTQSGAVPVPNGAETVASGRYFKYSQEDNAGAASEADPPTTAAASSSGSAADPTLLSGGGASIPSTSDPTASPGSSAGHTALPPSGVASSASQTDPRVGGGQDLLGSAAMLDGSGAATMTEVTAVASSTLPASCPVTRLQRGISQPKQYTDGTIRWCNLAASSTDEPGCLTEAMADTRWVSAMNDEYQALLRNKTWRLVP